MSTIKVPDASEMYFLEAAFTNIGTMYFHLFQSNTTPGNSDVYVTYTEADFSGYAPVAASWNSADTDITGKGEKTTTTDLVWTATGGTNVIYGYYVADGSNNLLWAERFDSSVSITSLGDTITIPGKFNLSSMF